MAVINTGLLTKGLKSEFFNRFDGTKTHFQDLATRIPSTSDSETYRWLGTVPQIREWGADSRQPSVSVSYWLAGGTGRDAQGFPDRAVADQQRNRAKRYFGSASGPCREWIRSRNLGMMVPQRRAIVSHRDLTWPNCASSRTSRALLPVGRVRMSAMIRRSWRACLYSCKSLNTSSGK